MSGTVEGAASGHAQTVPWLLGQKVAVPDRVTGYLDRAALVERAMPTRRRLTVLKAPGGFGKTVLLAECCRRLREDGVRTAWVSVDEQDEPAVLDTYIAYAFQCAAAGIVAGLPDLVTSDPGRMGGRAEGLCKAALSEIAALDVPFVLVFDELERLESRGSATLLEFLLKHGPANLHLAFACRRLPAGVNVAGAVLEGRAAVLSTDDLRFSRSEVAEFFDGKLTGARLAAVTSESAGWPFALRICLNEMSAGGCEEGALSQELVENWVESRLFAGLGPDDREFLLDIGLFERMDVEILDDVLERSDSMRRIAAMSPLAGLLEPIRDGARDVWRMHPLLRKYCVRLRCRETPQRFQAVHGRIAGALARRGQTAAAIWHATEAGEASLAGEIMERAGGVFLLFREGADQLQAADRRLSEEVIAERPRLELVRCLSLILSGRMVEARERYRSLAARVGSLEEGAGEAARQLAAENCVVRGLLLLYGGERFAPASMRKHLAEVVRLAESPGIDALTRGIMSYIHCIASSMTANFEDALDHAERARPYFLQNRYMTMFLDIQTGQVAMAQGRAEDAATHYRRAETLATITCGTSSEPAAICEVLLQELALECGRPAAGTVFARTPGVLTTGSSPFQVCSAASATVLEAKLRDEGIEGALTTAGDMLGYLRSAGMPALARYVSALRVSLLATAGRIGDAEGAWKSDDLPERAADCLDLWGQSWREMEALSCAWLRLAIGRGRFEEGREFANELRALGTARQLRRTLMRALALSAVLEHGAGDKAAAAAHVEEYERLYSQTPYAGPLVRERAELLVAVQEAGPGSRGKEAARPLLTAMELADAPAHPGLSERELDVLRRLEGAQDKQIAQELGLTAYGVRYRIRKLFKKLGVRKRSEAVRRARELGLLPVDL